ncbi:hypothetical protein [Terrisporobacter sp.]|uniref:hypothetical protein n=1 Tax=Terrisporobacter sp. TaxID=1965305 RepID=UPI002898F274|nr:hypothetical protein [Terrisporobacter sp.]
MNNVYELIKRVYIGGLEIYDSLGLFTTKEKANESKEYLEKYNPNEIYDILYRRVD